MKTTKSFKFKKKWLIISLIGLSIACLVGFFFFFQERERERERDNEAQISNTDAEKRDKFQTDGKKSKIHYPKWLKIQKLSSGNYLVKWKYGERVETNNISQYEETCSENCLSFAEMPKFLAEHCAYWENNDWTNWEKELKDNYLLVKEVNYDGNDPLITKLSMSIKIAAKPNKNERNEKE